MPLPASTFRAFLHQPLLTGHDPSRTDADGELHIDPPPTRPGDRFSLEARVPVLVGATACSAEKSNNGVCTPIDHRVERAG